MLHGQRPLLNLIGALLAMPPLAVAVAGLARLDHRWPDILVQFTAGALVAGLVLTAVLLFLRLRPAAALAGLACLLLVIAGWPQWFPPRGMAEADAPSVRLYSANVWIHNQDVDAIRRSIVAADADVVILIELGRGPAAQIDTVLAGYPHRVVSPRENRSGGPARTVIASRYPLRQVGVAQPDLNAIGAEVRTPWGPLNVVGVHLTRPWPYEFQWGQILQVRRLKTLVSPLQGPVLVAGDFNSVSSSRIGRQVQADLGLVPAPGWPGTWPSAAPSAAAITIDQVYRTPDLAILDRRLGLPTGSDHRPVITEFALAR